VGHRSEERRGSLNLLGRGPGEIFEGLKRKGVGAKFTSRDLCSEFPHLSSGTVTGSIAAFTHLGVITLVATKQNGSYIKVYQIEDLSLYSSVRKGRKGLKLPNKTNTGTTSFQRMANILKEFATELEAKAQPRRLQDHTTEELLKELQRRARVEKANG
jgi:hypothetical protein